ncbi:hypothetical protein [Mycoplasma simbae]|uniref:hypothetical protein n=1 Tax=Mycoplasma simbae TaxID=36744 RepID=UPI000497A98C|nr:hypothetical protein [Mycoplasma simbae]
MLKNNDNYAKDQNWTSETTELHLTSYMSAKEINNLDQNERNYLLAKCRESVEKDSRKIKKARLKRVLASITILILTLAVFSALSYLLWAVLA